jgi:hypothetical protein
MLSSTGGHLHIESMANFTAACDNLSNLTDYIRLYRQFKNNSASKDSGVAFVDELLFLDKGLFELTIAKLADVNMITLNWTGNGSDSLPYIEMHALVRRWLDLRNSGKIRAYTSSKMWLLGFGMYDHMVQGRVGGKTFEPLLEEIKASLAKYPDALQESNIPTTEIVFPFLLEAQKGLSKSIAHLPAGSKQQIPTSVFGSVRV